MASTKQLRIRLEEDNYEQLMAEAERRGISPSQVVQDALEPKDIATFTADSVYGAVLQMKAEINQILALSRLQGRELGGIEGQLNDITERLSDIQLLVLKLNQVDLSGEADPEPMTLEKELKLEIEAERFMA